MGSPGRAGSLGAEEIGVKRNEAQMNFAKVGRASQLDIEIEQLLLIQKAVEPLIKRASGLLSADFPRTAAAVKTIAEAFETELEANLLAAYDRLPYVPGTAPEQALAPAGRRMRA